MNVKTFEEACAIKGLDPLAILPDASRFPEKHRAALTAFAQLIIIAEAINYDEETKTQWEPNWNDDDEYKWFPWFDLEQDEEANPSGFRFYDSYFEFAYTSHSSGGSRLCFKSRTAAEYAGTQFIELYRAVMVLPK